MVVIVAEALAGGVTVVGLMAQVGVEVVACGAVTWQVKSTVPANPLTVPTVMLEDVVPPGATAAGANGAACRVKSAWAEAEEIKVREAAVVQRIAKAARVARIFNLGFVRFNGDDSNFNMSKFQ